MKQIQLDSIFSRGIFLYYYYDSIRGASAKCKWFRTTKRNTEPKGPCLTSLRLFVRWRFCNLRQTYAATMIAAWLATCQRLAPLPKKKLVISNLQGISESSKFTFRDMPVSSHMQSLPSTSNADERNYKLVMCLLEFEPTTYDTWISSLPLTKLLLANWKIA